MLTVAQIAQRAVQSRDIESFMDMTSKVTGTSTDELIRKMRIELSERLRLHQRIQVSEEALNSHLGQANAFQIEQFQRVIEKFPLPEPTVPPVCGWGLEAVRRLAASL